MDRVDRPVVTGGAGLDRQEKTTGRKLVSTLAPGDMYETIQAASDRHKRSKGMIVGRALELALPQVLAELDAHAAQSPVPPPAASPTEYPPPPSRTPRQPSRGACYPPQRMPEVPPCPAARRECASAMSSDHQWRVQRCNDRPPRTPRTRR